MIPRAAQEKMRGVIIFNNFFIFIKESAKRFTADIYSYVTTVFGYARRDLHLVEYGGVVLQRFEFIKFVWGKTL